MVVKKMSQKGFSLIELMVVVAIIGILSAVAVPQFQKFQRKAKQSEARANLSSIYTAEKIFLAEHGTYYTNLNAIGYAPEGLLVYNHAFGTVGAVATPAGYSTPALAAGAVYRSSYALCGWAWAGSLHEDCMYANGTLTDCGADAAWTATASTFTVGSKGRLRGSAPIDIWTINQRKELVNVTNGAL